MTVKRLRISDELMLEFLRNPTPSGLTAKGLPEDAKIVGAGKDYFCNWFELLIASETFRPEEADQYLDIVFTRGAA